MIYCFCPQRDCYLDGVQNSLTQKYVILDNANEANKTWGGGAGWVIRKHFLKMSLKNG